MLDRRTISVGKCYVKDKTRIAREVIALVRHRKVVYNAYDLRTGNLMRTPRQICPKKQLVRWADREAKPEEFAKLKRDDAMAIFETEGGKANIDDISVETIKARALTEYRYLPPNG